MFEFIASHKNGRKQGQKLPFPFLIYGVLVAQKELKLDSEFLTKKKPLVTYRLVEKAKPKEKKSGVPIPDPDVTTSAPTNTNSGPTLALLTQKMQELKAQIAKHVNTLGFVEKVSLDLLSKFKTMLPTTFTPHQQAVGTLVLGDVWLHI